MAPKAQGLLGVPSMACREYGDDAPWYGRNVPFFECSDPRITRAYAYRWKNYKAYPRDVGERGTVIAEFLYDVGWQKCPWVSLNDAAAFHLKEGRWLHDPRPVDEHVAYLYEGGSNDRHFEEGAPRQPTPSLSRGETSRAPRCTCPRCGTCTTFGTTISIFQRAFT